MAAGTASKKASAAKKATPKASKSSKKLAEATLAVKVGTTVVGKTEGVGFSSRDTKKADSVLLSLPMRLISVLPGFNPRQHVGDLTALTHSIKVGGLINPITVRPSATLGKYVVVAGERRYRACKANNRESAAVVLRMDLDDDNKARAVAVAENSEDGRLNLNYIEMGKVFTQLAKAGYGVAKIASDCGVGHQTVRRALKIMEAPDDVQKRVDSGVLSAGAGIEYARLDPKTRKEIAESLEDGISARQVRELGKASAKKSKATTDSKSANKKKGTSRDAALVSWKTARRKVEEIKFLAHALVLLWDEKLETKEAYRIEGALAVMLWDRGDLQYSSLADPDDPPEGTSKADAKKETADFTKRVKALAKEYVPEEPEEGEGSEG